MPELPEVETVVRSIAPLIGRRIVSAEFRGLRVLRGGDPDQLAARLAGRRIAGIQRYGKFIVTSVEGGGYLPIHPGMTGRLLLAGDAGKHSNAILTERTGRGLSCQLRARRVPPRLRYTWPMQLTLTPHAEELLRGALARHPGQSPAEIVEQALAERLQREIAAPPQPKRTRDEFHAWLDEFTAYSGKIPSLPGETFSRDMIYQDHD